MSEQQRADHQQAKYWNAPISRVEAQKVYDEQAEMLGKLRQSVMTLDLIAQFLTEKAGFTQKDIETWAKVEIERRATAMHPTQQTENPIDASVPVSE